MRWKKKYDLKKLCHGKVYASIEFEGINIYSVGVLMKVLAVSSAPFKMDTKIIKTDYFHTFGSSNIVKSLSCLTIDEWEKQLKCFSPSLVSMNHTS